MRHIFAKTAVAGLLVLGMTSCANDLNISSVDPQTSTSYEDMQLLAKVYGTLGMTGQKGPAGSGDISSDEGESGFYRTTFNLETLPTDECNWAWQTDTDIPQITGISWNANSSRTQWAYQRLGFNASTCCSATSICRTPPTRLRMPTTNTIVQRCVSSAHSTIGISSTYGTRLHSRTRTIP